MIILNNIQLQEKLYEFYQQNYGESADDVWYTAPAANVRMFCRGEKIVTLQCHILSGVVTVHTEPKTEADCDAQ